MKKKKTQNKKKQNKIKKQNKRKQDFTNHEGYFYAFILYNQIYIVLYVQSLSYPCNC